MGNLRMQFPFNEGIILTNEQIEFFNSLQGSKDYNVNSFNSTDTFFASFQEGQKLTQDESDKLYTIFRYLGYSDDICGWYCCDNNYGCNPSSPPPNCGKCKCCDTN